jgi:hypothetical protein
MNESPNSQFIPSSVSTSGAGYDFQHKVQAYYLLKLIDGKPTSAGRVIKIQFQARYEGIKTDDLVCTFEKGSKTVRVFMQCKSSIKARQSDPEFSSAILDAWSDFSAACIDPYHIFDVKHDQLALVYNADCASESMRTVRRVIQLAKNSTDPSDFLKKCHSKQHQEILGIIYKIVQPTGEEVPAKALWKFLCVLNWTSYQFEGNVSIHHDEVLSMIAGCTDDPESANLIWMGLIQSATVLDSFGATVDVDNVWDRVDSAILRSLTKCVRQINVEQKLYAFPWGAELWAVQALNNYRKYGNKLIFLPADDLLLCLRALRITSWLSNQSESSEIFSALSIEIVSNFDALSGTFDEKAALALFLMLNLPQPQIQRDLVNWAVRCASGPFRLNTSDVELTFRALYLYYYNEDVAGAERLEKYLDHNRNRKFGISGLRFKSTSLFISHWAYRYFDDSDADSSEPFSTKFEEMRYAIGDTYPDYRHPEYDTSALPGNVGVISFQALMKMARGGSVGEVLSKYRLCTSEQTFERLLNAYAEISAHLKNNITYISANDAYICRELEKLLSNSVADAARNLVDNKLTVLPIQSHFPISFNEVINVPFENISLATEFEQAAREEHDDLMDDVVLEENYARANRLWSSDTIFADVLLAMTLRMKLFGNSRSEAEVANLNGIGVSQINIKPIFHD